MNPTTAGHGNILHTEELSKSFDGFTAVDRVTFSIRKGEIHALIGPNGAGKTTLFNLITGFLAPSQGRIFYKDVDITNQTIEERARMGMIRSFQISAVFGTLTVTENVRIATQAHARVGGVFWRSKGTLRPYEAKAREVLQFVGLEELAQKKAGEIPYGEKRLLELATTLAMEPEIMLLDEPTQGMGHEDVGRIARLIKTSVIGRTILMVEHNMSVVSSIADRISVMQSGTIIATGSYSEVSKNPLVIQAYIGSGGHVRDSV